MGKLIELLNEYSGKKFWSLSGGAIECDEDSDAYKYLDTFIISKKFGFIKRLVENNKIDTDKFKYHIKYEDDERETNPTFTDELTMMLSISSTPLNDLFTLLK